MSSSIAQTCGGRSASETARNGSAAERQTSDHGAGRGAPDGRTDESERAWAAGRGGAEPAVVAFEGESAANAVIIIVYFLNSVIQLGDRQAHCLYSFVYTVNG